MARPTLTTDRELARLLSGRDEPSILEKEALFERIVAKVEPPRQSRFRLPWLGASVAAAGAVAAVVALLVVRSRGLDDQHPSEFLARGTQANAGLELACIEQEKPSACRTGAKLTFWVSAPPDAPHFAAFGRRPDGAIVWYVPDPGGRSLRVEPGTSPALLDTAVLLDDTHGAGPVTVFGVFSASPLSRSELKAALGPELLGDGSVRVIVRALEIGARP